MIYPRKEREQTMEHVTQAELRELEDLRAKEKVINRALKELEDGLRDRLLAGAAVNAGNLTGRVSETVRVTPAWKEVALGLGADEDEVRASTQPTVSYKVVIEPAVAKVLAQVG